MNGDIRVSSTLSHLNTPGEYRLSDERRSQVLANIREMQG
jgi:hypothetical protein